jgi:uncharacterized protein (TIGR03083 family)
MTRFVTEALVAAEIEPAPPRLRGQVLSAALARRPAGRPPDTVPLSPIESFRRTVSELRDLLSSLERGDWAAVVHHYGWTVQGLVGHLLAIERLLADRLGVEGTADSGPDLDHVTVSLPSVAAQEGRDPSATLADWRAVTSQVLDALSARPPDLAGRVEFHGVPYPWGALLVARTLEIWTHADDVRAALGRPPTVPDAERLSLMTELAVRTLPYRLATAGSHHGTARIVLTGPGGGAWTQPLSLGDDPGDPDLRLVADAVLFCRLSAGRITPDDLHAIVTGDGTLATAILATTSAFAV